MDKLHFHISPALLIEYANQIDEGLLKRFHQLKDSPLSINTCSFYTSVSAVFSSAIEGEQIDLDSYVKYKRAEATLLPDDARKIDDLYEAYQFAKTNTCNKENILAVHRMLTSHILPIDKLGKVRTGKKYVKANDGVVTYVAAPPLVVVDEMEKFYEDLKRIMDAELAHREVFFFAAFIHMLFIKIHPFDDGNGRTARLIEKWFLASKLGAKAWLIQSEKYYCLHHQTYNENIQLLGPAYNALDYSKALPFLLMLPQSLLADEQDV